MKRSLVILLACMIAILPGCSLPAKDGNVSDKPAVEDSDKDSDKDSGKDKSEWTSLDGKDNSKKNAAPEKIGYKYHSQPVRLEDGDDLYAIGCYAVIELDDDAKQTYPKLSEFVDKFDQDGGEYLTSYMTGSEDELRQTRAEGMPMLYEEDAFIHPERSDEKVFSFVIESYSFLGGAHGSTSYTGYNIDPETGDDIKFEEVVAKTDGLSQIIFDELLKQNDDLVDYFDELPTDKESLIEDITSRLEGTGNKLVWALRYDGIHIYFEDYAMGSYAAGSRSVCLKFADYPDVFTGKYDDYTAKKAPVIDQVAVKEDDADPVMLRVKGSAKPEAEDKTHEEQNEVTLSKGQRQKLNVFISNFAETGFRNYDEEIKDMSLICSFVYRWTRINRPADVEIEGNYYKISFDTIKRIAKKYLGRKISEKDLNSYPWQDLDDDVFFEEGYYFEPAADGESYTTFALVSSARDNGDGTLSIDFTMYSLDLDVYWDNNETIPRKYYAMTCEEASKDKDVDSWGSGSAVVKKDGDTYTLVSYENH